MRIALLLFAFSITFQCQAQRFFIELHGLVTEHYSGVPLKDVWIHVETGDKELSHVTRRDGAYSIQLDRGKFYKVTYSKTGYVTKAININGDSIPVSPDVPYYDMDVQMTLFEEIPDFDMSFFDEPIGEARYRHSVRSLSWDNEYSNDKRRKLSLTMNEYNKTYRGYYARTNVKPRPILFDSMPSDSLIIENAISQFHPSDTAALYYNDTSAAPAKQVETISGLFFTVQVGVYSRPVALDKVYNITSLNTELMSDGRIRYTSGTFDNLDGAEQYKEEMIDRGVSDAFIVAYFNGKRFPLDDALYLSGKFDVRSGRQ